MNQIFDRINDCNSFVGEQILFKLLHICPSNSNHINKLENKISYFSTNAVEREKVQYLLHSLGKDYGNYFLPRFLNNLEVFSISNIWLFRLMQIFLLLSILPSIFMSNASLLLITLVVFFINMIISIIYKAKYEIFFDSLYGFIKIIKVGKKLCNIKKYAYEKQFNDIDNKVKPFHKFFNMVGSLQKKKSISLSGSIEVIVIEYVFGALLWDIIKYDKIVKVLKEKQLEFI